MLSQLSYAPITLASDLLIIPQTFVFVKPFFEIFSNFFGFFHFPGKSLSATFILYHFRSALSSVFENFFVVFSSYKIQSAVPTVHRHRICLIPVYIIFPLRRSSGNPLPQRCNRIFLRMRGKSNFRDPARCQSKRSLRRRGKRSRRTRRPRNHNRRS